MKKNIIYTALMILFAGATVHAQDNWTLKTPSTMPPALFGHAMANIGGDKVLIFGGIDGNGNATSQTWIYDLSDNAWTLKSPAANPSARAYHAMAYIGDDKVLLFGGNNESPFVIYDDTWVYDLSDNTWTLKTPAIKPSGRYLHTMATIAGDQVLLFSGFNDFTGGNDQTWVYDLSDNVWTLKNPVTRPSPQWGHAMSNIGGDKVLLFTAGFSAETWVYDLSDNVWTLKNPAASPIPRSNHKMAFIGNDQTLLFGGFDNLNGPPLGDTWIYDLGDNTWTLKSPATHPYDRVLHAMASIGNNQVLLFSGGGVIGNNYAFEPDTWLYTSTEVSCSMTVSAGADEHLYYGYAPGQCKTKTVTITDGTAPFTYNWTLSRTLLPGETMTGSNTASVTVCLMDTAELCVTVTDAASCTANDCAMIFAEDVRCGTGNNQKVTICHNNNTICVDANAVPAHLAHGDYVGPCNSFAADPGPGDVPVMEVLKTGFSVYPNPGNGNVTVSLNFPDMSGNAGILQIINETGQVVKTINISNQQKINLSIEKSGVYIARLTIGRQVMNKKVIVIR